MRWVWVSFIVAFAGSPSTVSRTVGVLERVAEWLRPDGHVVSGAFLLDKHIERTPDGVVLAPEALTAVDSSVEELIAATRETAGVRR